MLFSDAVQAWTEYRRKLVDLGLVADSTYTNQLKISGVIRSSLGHIELDALRKSHFEVLFVGERLRTCAPVTVQGEMNVLRQVLNWCVDEEHLARKPRLPTVQVPRREDALPSDRAYQWVLEHVPAHHRLALEFMMLTGLSPHELERLETRDMPATGIRRIQIGMREDFAVKQASRRREVPLNDRAREIWYTAAAGLNDTQRPFPAVGTMEKAIARARMRVARTPAGVEDVTPKAMRRWFASKVSNEQPEHVLQRLMGHAPGSPITRRHYVRSTEAQGIKAVGAVSIG